MIKSSAVEQLVEKYRQKWQEAQASSILKLQVLRGIARDLHAERSRLMATSPGLTGAEIGNFEHGLDLLRDSPPGSMSPDFSTVLESPAQTATRTALRAHRPSLPDDFPPQMLVRLGQYDRKWELAIAEEAVAARWDFYRLEVWIEVPAIEAWSRELTESLWPSGVVLFAESGGFSKDSKYWMGRWTTIIAPSVSPIESFRLPALSPDVPAPPQWRLFFAPLSSPLSR